MTVLGAASMLTVLPAKDGAASAAAGGVVTALSMGLRLGSARARGLGLARPPAAGIETVRKLFSKTTETLGFALTAILET